MEWTHVSTQNDQGQINEDQCHSSEQEHHFKVKNSMMMKSPDNTSIGISQEAIPKEKGPSP